MENKYQIFLAFQDQVIFLLFLKIAENLCMGIINKFVFGTYKKLKFK
jgi:hypothetical protein